MEFDKFRSAELRNYNGPVACIKVLVVDANMTCRAIVSKMLLALGYEVVTAALASDALSIIEKNKNVLNLVLAEAHLPDMEIDELTEKIREITDLPSFIMTTDDDDHPSISRALCEGAKLCFRKPVKISDLQNMWRFAKWNRNETVVSEELPPGFEWYQSEMIVVSKDLEYQASTSMNTGTRSLGSAEGKEPELLDKDNTVNEFMKRKRLSRTDNLHKMFMEAVESSGIGEATPKKILQLMNVPGLTKAHIANYLQKYRQSIKPHANARQQCVNIDMPLTDDDRGKRPLFLEQQGVTNDPAFGQKDFVQFFYPFAHFPSQENSSDQESIFRQTQLGLPLELQGYDDIGDAYTFGEVLYEDAFLPGVYSTAGQHIDFPILLDDDIWQQFSPQLHVPLLPSDGIFEAGKVDEIIYLKGNQLFTDEDLEMWLATIPDPPNDVVASSCGKAGKRIRI